MLDAGCWICSIGAAEIFDFLGRRRKAGEVEAETPDKCFWCGLWLELQPPFLQRMRHQHVDGMRGATVDRRLTTDDRHLRRNERPVLLVLGTLRDPPLQRLFLRLRQHPFALGW